MSIRKLIRGALTSGPYYIRISRDRLIVRDATSGRVFDDEPLVALSEDESPIVVAIGSTARNASPVCINPFAHPRVIIDHFIVAEKLLMYAFKAISGRGWLQPAPVVVLHVLEELNGGISQIEKRAMREMLKGAGARQVYHWEGRELTDGELRSGAHGTSI